MTKPIVKASTASKNIKAQQDILLAFLLPFTSSSPSSNLGYVDFGLLIWLVCPAPDPITDPTMD